jgi:hypothetical protein
VTADELLDDLLADVRSVKAKHGGLTCLKVWGVPGAECQTCDLIAAAAKADANRDRARLLGQYEGG